MHETYPLSLALFDFVPVAFFLPLQLQVLFYCSLWYLD